MRNVIILAVLMVGLGTFMADWASRTTPSPAAATSAPRSATPAPRSATPAPRTMAATESLGQAGSRSLSIPRGERGHFRAEGLVNGESIDFMIDTGASVVVLNESSAARFGLRLSPDEYNAKAATANGTILAARTRLATVEVGGLIVHDVDAMVLPDEALSENLLGLSFLNRLKRFEYSDGRMVLEQ